MSSMEFHFDLRGDESREVSNIESKIFLLGCIIFVANSLIDCL